MGAETTRRETARTLLDTHGRTYAAEAGVRLRDTPKPLYQLLVLTTLLSAPIRASVAVDAARALYAAGMGTPRGMREATWQQRVDALGEGGYRRYDESTATTLGKGAEQVLQSYGGDLRRLREKADGDEGRARALLTEVPGIGPTGADIFLREAQGVWTEFAPWLDPKATRGAEKLGLPKAPGELARLVDRSELTAFAAALVRAALDSSVVDDVKERTSA